MLRWSIFMTFVLVVCHWNFSDSSESTAKIICLWIFRLLAGRHGEESWVVLLLAPDVARLWGSAGVARRPSASARTATNLASSSTSWATWWASGMSIRDPTATTTWKSSPATSWPVSEWPCSYRQMPVCYYKYTHIIFSCLATSFHLVHILVNTCMFIDSSSVIYRPPPEIILFPLSSSHKLMLAQFPWVSSGSWFESRKFKSNSKERRTSRFNYSGRIITYQ